MEGHRAPQTDEELVQILADLFERTELDESEEEVDVSLQALGYDPDALTTRMRAVIQEAMGKSPLNWRGAQRELAEARAKLEDISEDVSSALPRSRTSVMEAIEQVLAELGPNTRQAYAYRNFESLSDEDLASLLAELEYLAHQQHT